MDMTHPFHLMDLGTTNEYCIKWHPQPATALILLLCFSDGKNPSQGK